MLEKLRGKETKTMLILLFAQLTIVSLLALSISGVVGEIDPGGDYDPQLTVAGLPLSGLTEKQAQEKIQQLVNRMQKEQVILTIDTRQRPVAQQEIGVRYDIAGTLEDAKRTSEERSGVLGWWKSWRGTAPTADLPLRVTFDKARASTILGEMEQTINRTAVPAQVEITGSNARVIPEIEGRHLSIEKTITALTHELSYYEKHLHVPLVVDSSKPELTKNDLAGVETLLGEQRLGLGGDAARLDNVQKAASLLNGAVIKPQETFSFNARTGPFNPGKGYIPVAAPADKPEDGVSGGASQVASALYYSALAGRLGIVTRSPHLHQVEYASPGLDAFVDGKEKDLQLVNRSDKPIYIYATVQNNELRVALFGGKQKGLPAAVSTSEVQEIPQDTVVRADNTMPYGQERIIRQGAAGTRVSVNVAWYDEAGTLQKERVSVDYYVPIPTIIASSVRKEGEVANPVPASNPETSSSSGTVSNTTPSPTPPSAEKAPVPDKGTGSTKIRVKDNVIYLD